MIGKDPESSGLPPTLIHSLEDGFTPVGVSNTDFSLPLSPLPHEGTVVGNNPTNEQPAQQLSGKPFGDYLLIAEIARGGMGIVFKARERKLNRIVALKIIRADQSSPEEESLRFLAEAEAAAKLNHPHIVPIFEIGEQAGRLYFSMALIEGKSLAQAVRSGPFPPKKAASLMALVAEAVAYAHGKGIIHRDIKPGNIMLDAAGLPRITDFGLAKRTDSDSGVTRAGQIIGTPSYMPPEQAGGKNEEVGPLSDVYALGATLYCLLTGHPPFQAASVIDTLRQVEEREPVPPRHLNPALDSDLDTICLKCLEKRPERRYQSASELAADLGRFLNGQPIQARPLGTLGRAARWCRRNPLDAALTAMVAILLVSITAASLAAVQYIQAINTELVEAKNQAFTNAGNERIERRRADDHAAETRRQLERLYAVKGLDLAKDSDLYGAMLWWTQPFSGQHGRCERPESALMRLSLYWRYAPASSLLRMFVPGASVRWVAFSPDGNWLATASENGQAQVWDIKTGQPVGPALPHRHAVHHVAFSPDGVLLATSSWGDGLKIWEAGTGKPIACLLKDKFVESAAFSPDGKFIVGATNGNQIKLMAVRTGKEGPALLEHKRELNWVAFSRDGKKVVTASWDGTAQVWDARSGQAIGARLVHDGNGVTWAEFSPDGTRVVTAGWDARARLWDASTGKQILSFAGHRSHLRQASFSPDGQMLATASEDGTARVWESATGRLVLGPLRHKSVVWRAVFNPDGSLLATASRDGTAQLWDAKTGQAVALYRHQRAIRHLDFSRDGAQLAVASEDGTVRLWQVVRPEKKPVLVQHRLDLHAAHFSRDGKRLVTAGRDRTARVWNSETGEPVSAVIQHGEEIRNARFSPDGRWVVTASADRTARVWDAVTGKAMGPPLPHQEEVRHAEFSPDGQWVVTASLDRSARICDAASGKERFQLIHDSPVWSACYSPSGEFIGTGCMNGTVTVWDAATGQAVARLPKHNNRIVSFIAFSPDNRLVLSAGEDGNAHVSDRVSGERTIPVLKHGAAVLHAAFSSDGLWIVTASQDGSAQVWETSTGRPVSPPLSHRGTVYRAGFSPDGRWVVTGSADATARVWDAQSGQAVSPPLIHRSVVLGAAFSPDGRRILTASSDGGARVWDVSPDERRPADWIGLGELLCGHRLSYQGALLPVALAEMESAMGVFEKAQAREVAGKGGN